jgi:hypothetical protein
MLSKIGEKEEKQEMEQHETGSGVVVLQQTNQLLVSYHNMLGCVKLTNRVS